jgi:hypothetical protein
VLDQPPITDPVRHKCPPSYIGTIILNPERLKKRGFRPN